MLPDSGRSEEIAPDRVRKSRKPRGKRKAAEGEAAPVTRVLQLVAAIKAEHQAVGGDAREPLPTERVKLFASLRQLLTAREQERGAWRQELERIENELGEARASTARLRVELEQAGAQHRRALADLRLLHEHQRSIWQLERRRLEITVEGYEQTRRKRLPARMLDIAKRPAAVAALLLVSVVAVALARDSSAAVAGLRLYLDDARQFFLAAAAEPYAIVDPLEARAILPPR